MLSETSFRPRISASMRSSMSLRFEARRSSSSPVPATGSRSDRSPPMMRCVVAVMASKRRSTRRVTKKPPASPSTITSATEPRAAAVMISRMRPRSSRSRPTSRRKPPDNCTTLTSALCSAGVLLVEPAIDGLRPAGLVEHAGRERADIAGERLPGRRGHEIKARARTQRAVFQDQHEAAQSADRVLLGQHRDLGLDRRGDLLGDEAAGVEREIGEQRGRVENEYQQIDQRQPERGRADELTERRHGSCIRRRGSCAAAAAKSPCRSWNAGARCARRSRWSAGRSDSPTRSPAASCA